MARYRANLLSRIRFQAKWDALKILDTEHFLTRLNENNGLARLASNSGGQRLGGHDLQFTRVPAGTPRLAAPSALGHFVHRHGRQKPPPAGPAPSTAPLSGGSNRATTTLSLNSCPYLAIPLFHQRPQFEGSIRAATILPRGGSRAAMFLVR